MPTLPPSTLPRYQQLKHLLTKLAGNDLGIYEVPALLSTDPPTTTPAIKIVPPEPPTSWVPQGIEIIVQRVADIASQSGMHWSATNRVEEWTVILTQYNREEYNALNNVCDRILREFGWQARSTYQAQSEKAYERANIYIQLSRYLKAPNP
jgi:hypothetical protein